MHGYGLIIAVSIVVLLAIGYIIYNFKYFRNIKREVDSIRTEIKNDKDIEFIKNTLERADMHISISSSNKFHNPSVQCSLENEYASINNRDVYLWKGQELIAVNGISLLKETSVEDFRLIRMVLSNLFFIEENLDKFPYSPQQEF